MLHGRNYIRPKIQPFLDILGSRAHKTFILIYNDAYPMSLEKKLNCCKKKNSKIFFLSKKWPLQKQILRTKFSTNFNSELGNSKSNHVETSSETSSMIGQLHKKLCHLKRSSQICQKMRRSFVFWKILVFWILVLRVVL